MSTRFSSTIQALRKEKGLTQEQLANSVGVSPQAVSKWENGSYPDGELLPKLADIFGVSIDVLYGRAEREKSPQQALLEAMHDVYKSDDYVASHVVYDNMLNFLWAMVLASWSDNKNYYDFPTELTSQTGSLSFSDGGFILMRLNNDQRFGFIMPETEEGFGGRYPIEQRQLELFGFMSDEDNLKILYYLNATAFSEFVTEAAISTQLAIPTEKVKKAFAYLLKNDMLNSGALLSETDDETTKIYGYKPNCSLLMLLEGANMMLHKIDAYHLQINRRTKPLFNKKNLSFLKKPVPVKAKRAQGKDGSK